MVVGCQYLPLDGRMKMGLPESGDDVYIERSGCCVLRGGWGPGLPELQLDLKGLRRRWKMRAAGGRGLLELEAYLEDLIR